MVVKLKKRNLRQRRCYRQKSRHRHLHPSKSLSRKDLSMIVRKWHQQNRRHSPRQVPLAANIIAWLNYNSRKLKGSIFLVERSTFRQMSSIMSLACRRNYLQRYQSGSEKGPNEQQNYFRLEIFDLPILLKIR